MCIYSCKCAGNVSLVPLFAINISIDEKWPGSTVSPNPEYTNWQSDTCTHEGEAEGTHQNTTNEAYHPLLFALKQKNKK